MFCSKCGSENPDEAKFCGNCGATIVAATVSPQGAASMAPAVSDVDHAQKPSVSTALKVGVSIGAIIIPFIGLIMGGIYLQDKTNEAKRSVGKLWLTIGIVMFIINGILMMGGGDF